MEAIADASSDYQGWSVNGQAAVLFLLQPEPVPNNVQWEDLEGLPG